jgi:hypothetical protein
MKMIRCTCSLVLALSLALPVVLPTSARAASDSDPTNEVVAFGLLGAVIGILVYMGWKMDKEDRQHQVEGTLRQALASTDGGSSLLLISPAGREGEHVAGLGYGLNF